MRKSLCFLLKKHLLVKNREIDALKRIPVRYVEFKHVFPYTEADIPFSLKYFYNQFLSIYAFWLEVNQDMLLSLRYPGTA